jgi:hypothetical protein
MRILLLGAAALAVLPLSLAAFKEGPMPNVAGGFGEPTCVACHLDNPVNAPGGAVQVSGVPQSYAAGRTYAISVRLTRADLHRGGFEMGARFAAGPAQGRQAGTWRPRDPRVQLQASKDGAVQFAQHTTAGTLAATPGEVSWTFEWTAPTDATAPVQFNTAANASNDDASPLGDYIYTDECRSVPARTP